MLAMFRNKFVASAVERMFRDLLKEQLSSELIGQIKVDVHGSRDGISCHLSIDSKSVELLVKEMKAKGLEP